MKFAQLGCVSILINAMKSNQGPHPPGLASKCPSSSSSMEKAEVAATAAKTRAATNKNRDGVKQTSEEERTKDGILQQINSALGKWALGLLLILATRVQSYNETLLQKVLWKGNINYKNFVF